jgi:hypothetical protein
MSRKQNLVNRTIISLIEEEVLPVVKNKRVHCEIIEIDHDNVSANTGTIDVDKQNSKNKKVSKDEFTQYCLGKTLLFSSLFRLQ